MGVTVTLDERPFFSGLHCRTGCQPLLKSAGMADQFIAGEKQQQ
jgi:hypothetical protein